MSTYHVRRDHIEPLWDRIDRSRVQLAVFVTLFVGSLVLAIDVVVAVALALGFILEPIMWMRLGVQFWPVVGWTSVGAAGIALVYVTFALLRSERWILRTLGATLVPKGDLLPTKYALKDMAIAAGFPVAPALHMIETSNVNAFVLGKPGTRGVVGVTRGLVERMPTDEQRAVFANLMARLKAGDTIWATGVSALMDPFWRVDTAALRMSHANFTDAAAFGMEGASTRGYRGGAAANASGLDGSATTGLLWFLGVAATMAAVSELVTFGHRRAQLRHSELADAEGMLLLKDPRSMLRALEHAVRCNNFVPTAGPGFAQLFYCWSGDGGTDDEDDPENQRIVRLREVLGVEGMETPVVVPNVPVFAPPAPRLEG